MGAERHCDLTDGKNFLRERIVGYQPGHQLVLGIYETSMPVAWAQATITVDPMTTNRSRVTMVMEFGPKFGVLGRLTLPLIKAQFAKTLGRLLADNAAYVKSKAAALIVA